MQDQSDQASGRVLGDNGARAHSKSGGGGNDNLGNTGSIAQSPAQPQGQQSQGFPGTGSEPEPTGSTKSAGAMSSKPAAAGTAASSGAAGASSSSPKAKPGSQADAGASTSASKSPPGAGTGAGAGASAQDGAGASTGGGGGSAASGGFGEAASTVTEPLPLDSPAAHSHTAASHHDAPGVPYTQHKVYSRTELPRSERRPDQSRSTAEFRLASAAAASPVRTGPRSKSDKDGEKQEAAVHANVVSRGKREQAEFERERQKLLLQQQQQQAQEGASEEDREREREGDQVKAKAGGEKPERGYTYVCRMPDTQSQPEPAPSSKHKHTDSLSEAHARSHSLSQSRTRAVDTTPLPAIAQPHPALAPSSFSNLPEAPQTLPPMRPPGQEALAADPALTRKRSASPASRGHGRSGSDDGALESAGGDGKLQRERRQPGDSAPVGEGVRNSINAQAAALAAARAEGRRADVAGAIEEREQRRKEACAEGTEAAKKLVPKLSRFNAEYNKSTLDRDDATAAGADAAPCEGEEGAEQRERSAARGVSTSDSSQQYDDDHDEDEDSGTISDTDESDSGTSRKDSALRKRARDAATTASTKIAKPRSSQRPAQSETERLQASGASGLPADAVPFPYRSYFSSPHPRSEDYNSSTMGCPSPTVAQGGSIESLSASSLSAPRSTFIGSASNAVASAAGTVGAVKPQVALYGTRQPSLELEKELAAMRVAQAKAGAGDGKGGMSDLEPQDKKPDAYDVNCQEWTQPLKTPLGAADAAAHHLTPASKAATQKQQPKRGEAKEEEEEGIVSKVWHAMSDFASGFISVSKTATGNLGADDLHNIAAHREKSLGDADAAAPRDDAKDGEREQQRSRPYTMSDESGSAVEAAKAFVIKPPSASTSHALLTQALLSPTETRQLQRQRSGPSSGLSSSSSGSNINRSPSRPQSRSQLASATAQSAPVAEGRGASLAPAAATHVPPTVTRNVVPGTAAPPAASLERRPAVSPRDRRGEVAQLAALGRSNADADADARAGSAMKHSSAAAHSRPAHGHSAAHGQHEYAEHDEGYERLLSPPPRTAAHSHPASTAPISVPKVDSMSDLVTASSDTSIGAAGIGGAGISGAAGLTQLQRSPTDPYSAPRPLSTTPALSTPADQSKGFSPSMAPAKGPGAKHPGPDSRIMESEFSGQRAADVTAAPRRSDFSVSGIADPMSRGVTKPGASAQAKGEAEYHNLISQTQAQRDPAAQ